MRTVQLLTLIACVMTACGGPDIGAEDDTVSVESETSSLFYNSGRLWPKPARIPMCWDASTSGYETERGWVQDAIKRTWERVADVHFIFGSCSDPSVRVRIVDLPEQYPQVTGQGTGMLVSLNFTFQNQSRFAACRQSWNREDCIRTIAVHEFGHVLGLAHENNRPEAPSVCKGDGYEYPSGNATPDGAFDKYSIMNECEDAPYTRPDPYSWRLSPSDIRGIQWLYGRKPAGSISTINGLCIDNTYGRASLADQVWYCTGGENQYFRLDAGGLIRSADVGPSTPTPVMTIAPAAQGAYLWHREYVSSRQDFVLTNAALKTFGDLCLVKSGSTVETVECSSPRADWTLDGRRIKYRDGTCLGVSGAVGDGASLALSACNASLQTQTWILEPGGNLRTVGGWCLSVDSPVRRSDGLEHATVHLDSCWGARQRWTVDALISSKNLTDTCAAVTGSRLRAGDWLYGASGCSYTSDSQRFMFN